MKKPEVRTGRRIKVIRPPLGEKPRPTPESLERLRQVAEAKGWMKEKKGGSCEKIGVGGKERLHSCPGARKIRLPK